MPDPTLAAIARQARRVVTTAKCLRKTLPPGPFSPVERVALQGLLEIEKAAGAAACASHKTHPLPNGGAA